MKKIIDLTGKEQEFEGCMACTLNKGELELFGGVIYQNDYFMVAQDFEVPINGFIIISTKRHVSSINEFSETEKFEFVMLLDKVLKTLKDIGIAKEFILLQGERSDVHFHMSLFPRHDWMSEKFGRVVSSMKQIQEYAMANMRTPENIKLIAETCKMLKEKLNKEKLWKNI